MAVVLMMSGRALAADVSAGTDLNSAYIWRGITFNKGPVLQPWLDVSGIGLGKDVSLGVNVWSNVDLSDNDGTLKSGEFSEIDLTATLSLPKGFTAGYIEYTFPAIAPDAGVPGTRELFAGWSGSFIVDPSVTVYYDVDEVKDYYVLLGVGKDFTLNEKASVSLGGAVGLAGEDFAVAYGGESGGLYNFNVSGKLSYKASEKVTLTGIVGYSGSLDETHLPEQAADFYGGVGISVGL